ncbi:MAG: cyanophycin synthetase [Candidatus Thermoplasmatota archaeon]|nr:cyanophycin synthetase [Candidatus Thermoplasmatota archaeon]
MKIYDRKNIGEEIEQKIELNRKRFLEGPNVHALFPVMEAYVDLGDLVETPSDKDFAEKVVELLPELKEHSCSKGYKGGFVERLEEGTYPAHIIEHIAISIQNTVGADLSFGKSRREEGSVYKIVMGYEYASVASSALELSIELVNRLLAGEMDLKNFFEDGLEEIREVFLKEKIGPSTSAILKAAEKKDIPYKRIDEEYSLFSLGWGKNRKLIWGPETSETSLIGSEIGQEKDTCKDLLSDLGLPVPRGEVATSMKEALDIAEHIGYPVVIKPVSGNHGNGVLVNLKNPDELTEAFSVAKEHASYILVEKYLKGEDYRALIVNHEVVAVAKRIPAHVVGDGSSTIKELVELANKDPKRGEDHESVLTKLSIDEEVKINLEQQGLTLDHVPKNGENVWLRRTANISTGGTAIDHTEDIDEGLKRILERTSRIIGLDLMGVDIIAEDISRPVEEINWGIIEVNSSPGLRMHISPSAGEPQPVGEKIIDHLYPSGEGRIPLVAITGTNGKTTTSRMVECLGRNQGHHTGLAVTGGIWSNDLKVADGDTTGPWSANVVLQDPQVDYAVLETARGGMVKRGLGFDKADVGVVLNIREDHIGLDGVEDRDDIFWIKSLLMEVTDEEGSCVINGNDDYAERLIEKARGTPILFGVEKNQLIEEHIDQGGEAFVLEGNELVAYLMDEKRKEIANVKDLPYLRGGVKMLVENTLAAMSAAYASGLKVDRFKTALMDFQTNEETTPGRLNVFDVEGRNVVIDYAHNSDGLKNLSDFAENLAGENRKTLVYTGLGDRSDESLVENGKTAAEGFDKLIFTEKDDLRRGRESGEILSLLQKGSHSIGKDPINIEDMWEAVSSAMRESYPGDVIVYANLDLTSENLESYFEILENEISVGGTRRDQGNLETQVYAGKDRA